MIFITSFDINPLSTIEVALIDDMLNFGSVVIIPSPKAMYTEELLPLEERIEYFNTHHFKGEVSIYTNYLNHSELPGSSSFVQRVECFMKDYALKYSEVLITCTEEQLHDLSSDRNRKYLRGYQFCKYYYLHNTTGDHWFDIEMYKRYVSNPLSRLRAPINSYFDKKIITKFKKRYNDVSKFKKYIGED